MPHTPAQYTNDNRRLRMLIEAPGRRIDALWPVPEPDPRVENARLQNLLAWVRAYAGDPDRQRLERRGFLYPPIDPGCDPDSDWLQFTRWMAGQPLHWNFVTEFGPLPPADALDDTQLETELQRLMEVLATRNVVVDFQDGLPARVLYRCLKRELEAEPFDYMAPGTTCHMTGCNGYCPGCLQRPWCDTGLESPWPEDEDAGQLVCPDDVAACMPATAVLPQFPD